jgi:uncharacterized membrane protein
MSARGKLGAAFVVTVVLLILSVILFAYSLPLWKSPTTAGSIWTTAQDSQQNVVYFLALVVMIVILVLTITIGVLTFRRHKSHHAERERSAYR